MDVRFDDVTIRYFASITVMALLNWNPSICPIGIITNDLDQAKVYVMVGS